MNAEIGAYQSDLDTNASTAAESIEPVARASAVPEEERSAGSERAATR